MNQAKILVVDDEPNIVEVIRLYLEHANFHSLILNGGRSVIEVLKEEEPDLVLLDVMLPDVSGFELCEKIRGLPVPLGQIPIIMLTAKDQSIDKLRGFNLGVDDYIVKPFDPNELVARIKAVLRRSRQQDSGSDQAEIPVPRRKVLELPPLYVDLDQYKVTLHGVRVDLTPKEIELLYFLASTPGRVFTRDDLLGHVWNFDFAGGTRTVDAHVKNLRKKLGIHAEWSIQTLWGIGYSFEIQSAG